MTVYLLQSVLLVNGTEGYERWRKLPVALWYKVYFFNVTNPEEVQNGANPVVREVGPYVYEYVDLVRFMYRRRRRRLDECIILLRVTFVCCLDI
jgi:hypothetical protein